MKLARTKAALLPLLLVCGCLEADVATGHVALGTSPEGPDAGASSAADAPAAAVIGVVGVCASAGAEPECPAYPAAGGVQPIDPEIASGARCRGACGADCPDTCRSIDPIEQCLEWQDACGGWHYKICRWEGLIECGSHRGCREHDACYDACTTSAWPAACRRACDLQCTADYGVTDCYRWWGGNPPYDSWITYGPGTVTVDGPYDTTCY